MRKWLSLMLALIMALTGCAAVAETGEASDKEAIEYALNLKNMDQEWSYSASSDAWTLSIVTAVTNPVIADNPAG